MRIRALASLLALLMVGALVFQVAAEEGKKADAEKSQYNYIGEKKCGLKPCHGKDGIAESWMQTKHATVYDSLTEEQKKDKALMPFYTTGTDKKGNLLTNVQCEACHGPGSGYKSIKVMKDLEMAKEAGLIIPDEETCKRCHNAKAPTKALQASAKDWDFAKMKAKGLHIMPHSEKKESK